MGISPGCFRSPRNAITIWSESLKCSGLKSQASTMLNMAVFVPIASARINTVVAVNAGARRRTRKAW